ncbi:MAG: PD40 domain-containing protein [Verrucomicrobiales bacterium]|nr:PD40 domain-containing protein [Verrucomicrobiales bacterium]
MMSLLQRVGTGHRRPPNPVARTLTTGLALVSVAVVAIGVFAGCRPNPSPAPRNALVVVQTPQASRGGPIPTTVLDLRYPDGSRLLYVPAITNPDRSILLSRGLVAAGAPVLSPDGQSVAFVGKASASNPWQIYLTSLAGGEPRPLTSFPQGAMDPAWIGSTRVLFTTPIPRLTSGVATSGSDVPALHSLALTGGPPVRLTFGLAPAGDGTVLPDGRILFVSTVPSSASTATPAGGQSLFTINNDGTEISAYGLQHDGPAAIRRPRHLSDGRVVFLAAGPGTTVLDGRIEQILSSRPFRSRSVVFPQMTESFRSAECDQEGCLLVTLRSTTSETYAVYRLGPGATTSGTPWLDDPGWNEVEAIPADTPPRTAGRLSTIDPDKNTGVLLCLDARLTDRHPLPAHDPAPSTLRITAHLPGSAPQILGETPLAADGSFLVEVPADIPLGFDLLDPAKQVVRRCPPSVWTRPGENRACIGCHEPHSTAPDNLRPLAVKKGPVRFQSSIVRLTQRPTNP